MKRWRVTIEGVSRGYQFLQNIIVSDNNRASAENLAKAEFLSLGENFTGITEIEQIEDSTTKSSCVEQVEGRIFFGSPQQ